MRRAQNYLAQYRHVGVAGSVADASPHRLVALLLQAARERIRTAIAAIASGNIARKAKAINGAYAILEGLSMTLDHRKGGEIARGLDAIYQYGNRRLVEGNATNNPVHLQEVDTLLQEIESAWSQIPAAAQV
jgi:flagellar secretion chaperone FliS